MSNIIIRLIAAIIMNILTSETVKKLFIELAERMAKSTKYTIDDKIVEILKDLLLRGQTKYRHIY